MFVAWLPRFTLIQMCVINEKKDLYFDHWLYSKYLEKYLKYWRHSINMYRINEWIGEKNQAQKNRSNNYGHLKPVQLETGWGNSCFYFIFIIHLLDALLHFGLSTFHIDVYKLRYQKYLKTHLAHIYHENNFFWKSPEIFFLYLWLFCNFDLLKRWLMSWQAFFISTETMPRLTTLNCHFTSEVRNFIYMIKTFIQDYFSVTAKVEMELKWATLINQLWILGPGMRCCSPASINIYIVFQKWYHMSSGSVALTAAVGMNTFFCCLLFCYINLLQWSSMFMNSKNSDEYLVEVITIFLIKFLRTVLYS